MTPLEAAISLRERLRLPKDMVAIWLNKTVPVIKDRKVIEKAKTTICVRFNPKLKEIPLLPPTISGYPIVLTDIPWIPIEGQELQIAESKFMAREE